MPISGSQIILCDLPVRFDTYQGCEHGCKYCFSYLQRDIKNINTGEGVLKLKRFINGFRDIYTNWCDWDIPLHWGGLSDPFQEKTELKYRRSFECLKIFAETKYPFVVSTKSILPIKKDYYELFKKCNFVYQISMLTPQMDKLESGAPSFNERLKTIKPMSKIAKRVIIRLQPYIIDYHKDIKQQLIKYKNEGAFGIVIEGIKLRTKIDGMVKIGLDYCYPYKILKQRFEDIKEECRDVGLKFYCGENRMREMGDSLNCCGTDGIEGFVGNKANLNHYLYDKDNFKYTDAMLKPNSGRIFMGFSQNTLSVNQLRKTTFEKCMDLATQDRGFINIFKSRI